MCSPLTNKTMPLEDPQFVKLSLLDSAESLSVPAVPVFKTHHDIAQHRRCLPGVGQALQFR